ncbi:MAG: endonuclease/exonuclease/phosphatase family protein [Bacteroidetes bacterium]|nr:MAG: endonuclease/exonuclease/phosphatase family protein [Bacteroidota bacterium]
MAVQTLNIIHINANGYRARGHELTQLINDYDADIISIQETVTNNIRVKGYVVHCNNYERGKNRGIAILVKQHLAHEVVNLPDPPSSHHESLAIDIKNNIGVKYRVISSYISRHSAFPADYLAAILNNAPNTIWVGDLNSQHTQFGDTRTSPYGIHLLKLARQLKLINHNTLGAFTRFNPSCPPSILDYPYPEAYPIHL